MYKRSKKGCGKFPAGVFGKNNEAVGIKLDFIPMWLAKVTISKKWKTTILNLQINF